MKRGAVALLAVVLAFSLTACGERKPCPEGQHWEDHGYSMPGTIIVGKTIMSTTRWHSRWVCVQGAAQ